MDYREFYYLDSYLENTVQKRFHSDGYLSAFDFFCIIIWKSNRAKSRIARKLLSHGYRNLDSAVKTLTGRLSKCDTPKSRFRYLIVDCGFGLPMATAILTILYPNDFTIYDYRVCNSLGDFHRLNNKVNFERLWDGYKEFMEAVKEAAPHGMSLRDKDRYLWGQSFYEQLIADIEKCFEKRTDKTT